MPTLTVADPAPGQASNILCSATLADTMHLHGNSQAEHERLRKTDALYLLRFLPQHYLGHRFGYAWRQEMGEDIELDRKYGTAGRDYRELVAFGGDEGGVIPLRVPSVRTWTAFLRLSRTAAKALLGCCDHSFFCWRW